MIPTGEFLCRQVDLAEKVSLVEAIESVYEKCESEKIIVSNMLLDKYQIGTKKSEFQKLSEQNTSNEWFETVKDEQYNRFDDTK